MKYNRQDLIEKLIVAEGLRLQVYKDTLGIDTIGIGRNLEDRGITKEELADLDIPTIEHEGMRACRTGWSRRWIRRSRARTL